MAPRTILHTGTGGVGTTSVAAATARRLAADGMRTLLLSIDPGGGLRSVLGEEIGSEPRAVAPGLDAQQVVAQHQIERRWATGQGWLGELLTRRGIDRITADELIVPPGLDALFSLLELRRHHDQGHYEAIVVDCPAAAATLELLSAPDVARWWLERAIPQRSGALAAAVALPDGALRDVHGLVGGLVAMNEILRDHEHVSVRLVMTPHDAAVAGARSAHLHLSLYGLLTDAVIVNRVLPAQVDGYFGPLRELQAGRITGITTDFAPVPVLQSAHFAQETTGPEMLDRLGGELFTGVSPAAILHDQITQELTVSATGATLRLDLPYVDRDQLEVKQVGLDLIVRAADHKRALALPAALGDYRATGAVFRDGTLNVTFDRTPIPADA